MDSVLRADPLALPAHTPVLRVTSREVKSVRSPDGFAVLFLDPLRITVWGGEPHAVLEERLETGEHQREALR